MDLARLRENHRMLSLSARRRTRKMQHYKVIHLYQNCAWSCITSHYSPLRGSHYARYGKPRSSSSVVMMLCSSMHAFETLKRAYRPYTYKKKIKIKKKKKKTPNHYWFAFYYAFTWIFIHKNKQLLASKRPRALAQAVARFFQVDELSIATVVTKG